LKLSAVLDDDVPKVMAKGHAVRTTAATSEKPELDQREFHCDEPFEIKAAGAKAGLNPMFGEAGVRVSRAASACRSGGRAPKVFADTIGETDQGEILALWSETVAAMLPPPPKH
jgi:hypothetical protein